VIQRVPGVVATDLDQLYRYQEGESPPDPTAQIIPEVVDAARVQWDVTSDQIRPAELLLINPVGITLEEMTP
jgi:hypothetical protein